MLFSKFVNLLVVELKNDAVAITEVIFLSFTGFTTPVHVLLRVLYSKMLPKKNQSDFAKCTGNNPTYSFIFRIKSKLPFITVFVLISYFLQL